MAVFLIALPALVALPVGGLLALRWYRPWLRRRFEAEFEARNAALFEQLAHLERANAEHHCPPGASDWAVLDRQGAPSMSTPR